MVMYIVMPINGQFYLLIRGYRVSAMNNAKIYRAQHYGAESCFPLTWSKTPQLNGPTVSDAFFLYALLRDHDEHGTTLALHNDTDQSVRLNKSLRERNATMVGPGQEHWSHACDLCCMKKEIEGRLCECTVHFSHADFIDISQDTIRAVVMDGVTVGRPCCSVHDCQGHLPSQQARFCSDHVALDHQCAVVGCENANKGDFKTCAIESHRTLEKVGTEARSALFQLRKRLVTLRIPNGPDMAEQCENEPQAHEAGEPDVDEDAEVAGENKLRARFSRRWTHNEQLCVATCGTITGRMTMFGSEAVSGARVRGCSWLVYTVGLLLNSRVRLFSIGYTQHRTLCHKLSSMIMHAS